MCYNLYDIFNNASIAGILSVILSISIGFYLAKRIYRTQKKIDKISAAEDDLCKKTALLYEHCEFVNLRINTIVNTWKTIVSKQNDAEKSFFIEGSLKNELNVIAKVLMYQIPEDRSSIRINCELYFSEYLEVKSNVENIFTNLKNWHENVQQYFVSENFPKKYANEVENMSLVEIEKSMKNLFKLFKK